MKTLFSFLVLITLMCCKTKTNDPNIATSDLSPLVENTTHLHDNALAPFYHGVASGDPHQTSVVLWTRITPKESLPSVSVQWVIAEDDKFIKVIGKGEATTGPEKDYTVKVIAENLSSGTNYFYRFDHGGNYSRTGITKTAPSQEQGINLAVVSCSNVEFGYFNSYAAIAEDDVDVVLHLGDYIYEYGIGTYGDSNFSRKNIPKHEIISLQDYRDRYSQYRLDPDLQDAHSAHAFINIWDDHEISNNAYVDGAQNHQAEDGDYEKRKSIARQVFYEWIPIREGENHYRKFEYGKNLDLFMLDERLAGRTAQLDSITDPRVDDPSHALLGNEQMNWLATGLKNSKATWKIIGNQVIFSSCDFAYDGFNVNLDAWDGYPREQEVLAHTIRENNTENVIFVTGDTHTAWAFEATNNPYEGYNALTGEGAVGIEFGVTSINSANSNESNPDSLVIAHESKISNSPINPHLKYVNMRDHGYLKLMINSDDLQAEYNVVPTLTSRTSEKRVDKAFLVNAGKPKLNIIEN